MLSAFGRFGSYISNPTEIVAGRLNGKNVSGFTINTVVFEPVICGKNIGLELLHLARNAGAKGVVCLGVASEKSGLCVESSAVNRICNEKYCASWQNNTPIDRNRPYGENLDVCFDLWNLEQFFGVCHLAGVPVMPISKNAGMFCCNSLMYQLCVAQIGLHPSDRIPFIFIHTPCSPESIPDIGKFLRDGKITMTIDQIIHGLSLLLESFLLGKAFL